MKPAVQGSHIIAPQRSIQLLRIYQSLGALPVSRRVSDYRVRKRYSEGSSDAYKYDTTAPGPCRFPCSRPHSTGTNAAMADIATEPFLNLLKAAFPSPPLTTPEGVLAQPWYIVAAVSFSASRKPAAVPVVFAFVLRELEAAQLAAGVKAQSEEAHAQRFKLASKIREALLHSGLLSGIPRVGDMCLLVECTL